MNISKQDASAIPSEAPGLVVHSAGDVRVESVQVKAPAADEAVVRIAYGGVCGSDLHYWKQGAAGESILREPMLLGHEVSGRVAQPAADGSGPPAGTPVAATRGGLVVLVGLLPPGEQPVAISKAISRELSLIGSFRFNEEIDSVIAALGEGELDLEPVIIHEFALDDALGALQVASDPRQSGKVLLRFSPQPL